MSRNSGKTTTTLMAIGLLGCSDAAFDPDQYSPLTVHDIQIELKEDSVVEIEAALSPIARAEGFQLRVDALNEKQSQFRIVMWRPDSAIVGGPHYEPPAYAFLVLPSRTNPINKNAAIKLLTQLEAELRTK